VALAHLVAQIEALIDNADGHKELADSRKLLAAALDDARAMVAAMTGYMFGSQQEARELYRVGLGSVRFLLAVGDLVIGWLLMRQAEIALTALDQGASGDEQHFYRGKVAAAKFFAANVLPRLGADRRMVESEDLALMDLSEDAF
jgi:hypothetical protein